MLAKQHRLVKQKDFEKVFKQGRAYYTKLFGTKTLANQLEFNRFGIVISTKVSKKATERNRLKRQVRQAVRDLDKNLKSGLDLVIIVLPAILTQEDNTVEDELKKIFIKLNLFK